MNEINCGLSYYLPESEKPHTLLRVPGGHTLYVGPPACSRRHAFDAITRDYRGRASFLLLSEHDVSVKSCIELISGAIGELLELLPVEPHIFFVTVFCIDDLLGTDEDVLLEELHTAFPDKQFVLDRINPNSLKETKSMGGKLQANIYSFLRSAPRSDNGVNFLGNFVSLDPDCEIFELLKTWHIGPVREIFNCENYNQYQEMSQSRLNLILRNIAEDAAIQIRDKLGIPYFYFPSSYDAGFVMEGYREIAKLLGCSCPELPVYEQTLEDAKHTARLLSGYPLAIGADAFLSPFAAAKALIGYGFNVRYILRSRHKYDADAKDRDYILENHPDIEILEHADSVRGDKNRNGECLSVGTDCAKILKSRFTADIWHDEGYFGFHGIRKLMSRLRYFAGSGGSQSYE